jgi:hypothetical protein
MCTEKWATRHLGPGNRPPLDREESVSQKSDANPLYFALFGATALGWFSQFVARIGVSCNANRPGGQSILVSGGEIS